VSSAGPDRERLSVLQRGLLRWRPRIEQWQRDWVRARYLQDLPHLRADTEVGPDAWIIGGEHIHFGAGVRIGRRARLQTIVRSGAQAFVPRIEFGDRVSLEDDCHLGALGLLVVESDVLVASHVLVLDHAHDYTDRAIPVARQALRGGGLRIGSGSHIGENACLLGPLTIGSHAVVGAGSIVLSDVPDFTVVVGAPARPVKRYDAPSGEWVRV
jgi:acetyltransferase-like isoleucine patch superfamily enzyme